MKEENDFSNWLRSEELICVGQLEKPSKRVPVNKFMCDWKLYIVLLDEIELLMLPVSAILSIWEISKCK